MVSAAGEDREVVLGRILADLFERACFACKGEVAAHSDH